MLESTRINHQAVLFLIILGVLVPLYGIYGALTAKVESYSTVAIVLGITIFRLLRKEDNFEDPTLLLVYLPFLAGIILGVIIPIRLKSKYTKTVTKKEVDGKMKSIYKVTFEKDHSQPDDLLDTELN